MRRLLLADPHFTAVPRDAYRWRIFPWLQETITKHSVKTLLILGDLTEAKNYHSAVLVNQLVEALFNLHQHTGVLIEILPGNHDSTDPECPYFRFLRRFPFVRYFETPRLEPFDGKQALYLPHTRNPLAWPNDLLYDADIIFMHQTVAGARSESGQALEGIAATALAAAKRAKAIWSGDVHVPQTIGPVEYVGAPYPIRFGDAFKPRAVLLHGNGIFSSLDTPPFNRLAVSVKCRADLAIYRLKPGDQVKIKVSLTRAEFVNWAAIKRDLTAACEQAGADLCGLEVERIEEKPKLARRGAAPAVQSPQQVLTVWCGQQQIEPALAEAGQAILATVVK